ncbi:sulfoxide reductase heme-binding subunit YedZ [Paracoccus sp. S-4012]|uniref:ferric reductase-like transmembrane domain-containing protein n=1 Tax=Paracoccus sp. S-4012 TaxID=2665648 RepID=UPI0012B08854|nr:ferric reductase-like transmembrane domain-containing protein [Paracoccus sp. S-4012]MRX49898.1 sulfoxide reductase heme-binding subunit YedZ [Paracoccus sp. S-4012]
MRAALNAWLKRLPEWLGWMLGAIPLLWLIFDLAMGAAGPDPVAAVEHRTGRTGLYFLVAALVASPVARFAGVEIGRMRRVLGLLGFAYAALHVAAWMALDLGFYWPQIARDLLNRPYLIMGTASALLLLPLALTSNGYARRALGKWWPRLHQLAYPAAALAALHWAWVGKLWEPRPASWLTVILGLAAVRWLPTTQNGTGRHQSSTKRS